MIATWGRAIVGVGGVLLISEALVDYHMGRIKISAKTEKVSNFIAEV